MGVMELVREPAGLFLDTSIDHSVNVRGTSVLVPKTSWISSTAEAGEGSNKGRSSRPFSIAPFAGSKNWLPALVAACREEARARCLAEEGSGRGLSTDANASGVFFAVDVECVLHKYRRWYECFPRIKPFYAIKCNPNPVVVSALAMVPGCGFDCASPAEIDLVLGCGVHPSRIIYANPCKETEDLQYALSAGISTVTFDCKEELLKIRRLLNTREQDASGRQLSVTKRQQQHANLQVVLRLKVPDAHSECPLGEKFGAVEEVCSDLIVSTIELGLDLVGASFHCGSGCQDAEAYATALKVAKRIFDLAAEHGIWMSLLDIGGGFPGWDGSEYVYNEARVGSSSPLSLEKIAEITCPVLEDLFPASGGVQVIAEPGRYFVEASHVLFARIYAKRRIALRDKGGSVETAMAYFIEEGVDGCFKDRVLFGVCFEPCPVSAAAPVVGRNTDGKRTSSEDSEQEKDEDSLVMGPSGSPTDIVARKRLPKSLGPGDWLYFSRMGAYTASIASSASSAALEAPYFYVASAPANQ